MNIANLIVIAVVLLIVGLSGRYVWKARKKGIKCIGCPEGSKSPDRCSGCSGNCCGQ